MGRKILFLLVLLILIIPACLSLWHPGFFSSHDGDWMVIRLTDFHRSFVSGQIPVRWGDRLNYGYGYPVFNFVYPFSFYVGEVWHLLGFSFVNSVKIVLALSLILSGAFMYFWLRGKWGPAAGLAAAVLYVYTPYRFLDVYVRGSLGEALAFIFPPLIFWSAEKLAAKWRKNYFVLGSLAFAGLITCHNTAAMLFTSVFLGYLIFHWLVYRARKIFFRQITILLTGLLLSCFFWLPALFDKQYVLFDQVMVANFFVHFPTFRQLLQPSWGFGPSLPLTDQETISFQVGLVNLGVFLLVLGILARRYLQKTKDYFGHNFPALYFTLVFIGSFLLMLENSFWVWRVFPVENLIQFPWRLLMLTTFGSAVLAGGLVQSIKPPARVFFAAGLIAIAIFLNYHYARPENFNDRGEAFYSTNESTTTIANEYMPVWVKSPPTARPAKTVEVVAGQASITAMAVDSQKISFTVAADDESIIQLNKIYFPGWQVKMDGEVLAISHDNPAGVIQLAVPAGQHFLLAEFGETPIRLAADLISLSGLMVVVGLVIKKNEGK